jgi:basic membrane protein A
MLEEDHTLLTKRSIAAVFTAAFIFAACSSGAASQSPSSAAPSAAAPSTPASAGASAPAASASAAASGAATGFAACGSENAGTAVKIGGVTDVGRLDDKSFNEAGWCGTIKGATAVKGSAKVIVTKDKKDYQTNMKLLIDEGATIIVTYGFALGGDTAIAAKANPTVSFIGIDQFICVDEAGVPAKSDPVTQVCLGKGKPEVVLPNYQGLVFNEAQAGYLAGVLAGSLTKSKTIGTVGGIFSVPPVPQYMGGYENGAKSVNPDIKVLSDFVSTDIAKAFTDPVRGKAIADQMVSQGADVLFQVAGGSGQGVLQAACDNNLLGIGVDVDQYLSAPKYQKCLLTSAEKKLVDNTASAIQRIVDKTAVGGNIFLSATNTPPGIGLAPYHDLASMVTPEILAKVDAAFEALKGGLDPCKGSGKCFFDPDK